VAEPDYEENDMTRKTMARWSGPGARFALAALVALACAAIVFAVHDLGLFELEGNAVNEAAAGDDWDQIYCDHIDPDRTGVCGPIGEGGDPKVAPSNALVSRFLTDPVESTGDDMFDANETDTVNIVCGASDPPACKDWQWKVFEPNDKNDIEHGYAAIYNTATDNSGDYILYFGMDKLSNNGDAAIGFWFLQNDVKQLGTNEADNPFSAGHLDGDVLVQADITSGGDVPRFDVYTWGPNPLLNDPVAPSQGALRRAIEGAECDPATTGDDTCAIMNTGAVTAPWPYKFKSSGVNDSPTFPVATFFEAGLNLSTLFPEGIPCISTFLAETRQSQSETATLEDKLIGSFDLCSISVDKDGPEKSKKGDPASYTITVTNDGALPLNKFSIIDDKLGDLTSQCGATLNPGQSCTINVSATIPQTASDPFKNTVTAIYKRDTATVDTTVTGTAFHEVDLFQPSITFDKKAEGSDGPRTVLQGATVDYTLTLNNASSGDTPPLDCEIVDALLGVNATPTLTSGQSVTVNASMTFLTTATPFVNKAHALCSPQGFTNKLPARDTVTVNVIPSNAALVVDKKAPAYAKVGDTVTYTIRIDNISGLDLELTSITDTLLDNLTDKCPAALPAGGFCEFTYDRAVLAGDPDPLINTVTAYAKDAYGGTASDSDDHSVDLVHPSFTVTKDCLAEPVAQGETANFRIRIDNTGDVSLTIDVTDDILFTAKEDILLAPHDGECGNQVEWGIASTGCYEIEAGVVASGGDVSNTVTVHATLEDYDLPNFVDGSASATCEVTTAGLTRTWGFWKTHGSDGQKFDEPVEYGYTCHVFEDHLGSSVNLGSNFLSDCFDVFGVFWADPSKLTNGTKRSQTSKTVLHASQQLLAAILNSAIGAEPPAGLIDATIDALEACSDNDGTTSCSPAYLKQLAGQLAAYNESGDDVAIVDDTLIPHADPRGTRTVADLTIANFVNP
jgi:uncharacterized repeat protein (TIGR01451 family)